MQKQTIRHIAALLLLVPALTAAISFPAGANDDSVVEFLGVAIDGYDPVAYFTEGQALKGSEAFTHFWNDAEWRFISAAHRDLFAADPEKYAPRHGGF